MVQKKVSDKLAETVVEKKNARNKIVKMSVSHRYGILAAQLRRHCISNLFNWDIYTKPHLGTFKRSGKLYKIKASVTRSRFLKNSLH